MSNTIIIRRVSGSLRISIPADDVRELGLRHGDVAVWTREDGSFRVRFAKVAEREEQAGEPVSQTAA